jgi:hypothetical protein
MIATVTPGYETTFNALQQIGLTQENLEEFAPDCDTASWIKIHRGEFKLILSDSNDQFIRFFDIQMTLLGSEQKVRMSVVSAGLDPDSDECIEPWRIELDGAETHPDLKHFIDSTWPELWRTQDLSQILPDGQQLDPESQIMHNFIRKLFLWFRRQPA